MNKINNKKIKHYLSQIKYFFKKFEFLKVYNSPFKFIVPKLHIGKVAVCTPYFYPRKTVKSKTKPGYLEFVPKKIGFDFVELGWKTKWTDNDYRFEWSPIWSFVFFKWQIAIIFSIGENNSHYWECWLAYSKDTDKSKSTKERIEQARKIYPCIWTLYKDGEKTTICYWDKILKQKWL